MLVSTVLLVHAAVALATGPAAAPAPVPPPGETEPATPPGYDANRARDDLRLLLEDTGRLYLDARARLTANPTVAAPVLAARLDASPALLPPQKQRILHVLAGFKHPGLTDRFAAELRRLAASDWNDFDAMETATRPWRALLRARGADAGPAFAKLVGDTELSTEFRAMALEDLVEVTAAADLGSLVSQGGAGDVELQRALRAALVKRARDDAATHAALVGLADQAIASGDPSRTPWVITLRGRLDRGVDPAFTATCAALAADGAARFPTRVAAIRVLAARSEDPAARKALAETADTQLAPTNRTQQTSEILGWLALRALPAPEAKAIADRHQLLGASAPRLLAQAYRVASLPADDGWLKSSLDNPWPQVRVAAFARVPAGCSDGTVRLVARAGGNPQDNGDPEPVAARAALAALGTCGTAPATKALRSILGDAEAPEDRRAEAARQLVRKGQPSDADYVAGFLRDDESPGLRRALAAALGDATPSDPVVAGLCRAIAAGGPPGRTARDSLRTLVPGDAPACAEPES